MTPPTPGPCRMEPDTGGKGCACCLLVLLLALIGGLLMIYGVIEFGQRVSS